MLAYITAVSPTNFSDSLHFIDMYRSNARSDRPQTSAEDSPNVHQSPLPLLVPANPRFLEKHLPYRQWLNSTYQEHFRRTNQEHFKFQVICYNILSQALLEENGYLYENCFWRNLKWWKRRDRLIREFLRHDADILCLQEMQIDHYEHDFRPTLKGYGYDSVYLKRSGDKPDGCCIFYKINRLKLINSKLVPFYHGHIPILDKDNCGLIALFQPLTAQATPNDVFCVATTHLLFSTKRGDIKLAQIQYFLAEIDQFSLTDEQTNSHYPIILCGDFNVYPQSPLIQFLLTGYIKYDAYRCIDISGQLPDSKGFSYQLPTNELLPQSFVTSHCRLTRHVRVHQHQSAILTHDKNFHSVYDTNDSTEVTSAVKNQPKTVDYMFFTRQSDDPDRLNILSRYELYQVNQMDDIHMPNHQFPSDHFLLSAKFALKYRLL